MKLDAPADARPRREVEAELVRQYGDEWLCITVQVQSYVSKRTGEVRYKPKTTRYKVERLGGGRVKLVTDRNDEETRQPIAYVVDAFGCDCPDWQFVTPHGGCKHQLALLLVGFFVAVAAGGAG